MALCALVTVLVAMLVLQRGARATEVLPVLALALVSGLIAFNKVGSPQFMTWLAVPVILGLATPRQAGSVVPHSGHHGGRPGGAHPGVYPYSTAG